MSIDYRTYVGPYIQCRFEMVEVQESRRACTNPNCPNHTKSTVGAFCSRCGSPIGDVYYSEQQPSVNWWDVSEAIDEHLYHTSGDAAIEWSEKNGIHIWLPNISTEGRDYQLDDEVDFSLTEIKSEQISDEVSRFVVQFVREINTLQKTYGYDNVTPHWGIVQDYT